LKRDKTTQAELVFGVFVPTDRASGPGFIALKPALSVVEPPPVEKKETPQK